MWLHVTLYTRNRWWSEGDSAHSSRLSRKKTATSKNPIWHAGEQAESELPHQHPVLLMLHFIMPKVVDIMNTASGDAIVVFTQDTFT